ncbi:MAG TPA: FAD-binding oxidoreductase [Casimicrobiaceae bacterium]|nr:FAD-binding oxidoreductase [Casimicrobiaceae bacterium]
MRRRSLLKLGVAAALQPLLCTSSPAGAAAQAAKATVRRVRPGDAAWPGAAAWQRLNDAVGGNLINVDSLFAPCREMKRGACIELWRNIRNPFYLGDQPGGTEVSGWLDAWTPQPSAYAVRARNADDVVAAVNFGRDNNLRLVVKGGGHSYQGTSNAPDSLLIWTRGMNRIALHDAFVPRGCPDGPLSAVTIEAGALWIDAYDEVTTKAGRYVQGGGCASVGVAGLIQSGGFGSHSKNFGTAAASLLEAQIVTADGRLRTANACTEPELFWAIKGGGGGSWGVITSLTLRTYDLPEHFGYAAGTIEAKSDEAFHGLLARFVDFYATNLFNPHWGESVKIRPENALEISMVSQGLDDARSAAAWKPFFDWARDSSGYTVTDPAVGAPATAREWWDVAARRKRGSRAMVSDPRPGAPAHHAWWSGDQDQVYAFLHGYESIWLPAALLAEDRQARLVNALFDASRHWEVQLHFNKGLAGAPAEAIERSRDTATNPAALDAFALAIVANGGVPGLSSLPYFSAQAHRHARAVDAATADLEKIAPEAGSYVAESNYFNDHWQRAFWGANYPRLLAAKAKYDPDGLFFVHHGVGSEGWSEDGFRRSRA